MIDKCSSASMREMLFSEPIAPGCTAGRVFFLGGKQRSRECASPTAQIYIALSYQACPEINVIFIRNCKDSIICNTQCIRPCQYGIAVSCAHQRKMPFIKPR